MSEPSSGDRQPAPPQPRPPWPISAVVRWLGFEVRPRDASLTMGVLWYASVVAALRLGSVAFGLVMAALAMVAAQQAVSVRIPTAASSAPRGGPTAEPTVALDARHRLPAAALAGAVVLAAVVDTRLAGAVLGAAVVSSFVVVAALRSGRAARADRAVRDDRAVRSGRSRAAAASVLRVPPLAVLARVGWLVRAWMHAGVGGACCAAVARHSLGATLVLVTAAAAYDACTYVTAAGRPPSLRGPLAGVIGAAAVIYALTGLSVPPFAPTDFPRLAALAALTLPLGPAAARPITALASRTSARPPPRAESEPRERISARVWQRLTGEWAVRRIDSLSITALAWMWALGLLGL